MTARCLLLALFLLPAVIAAQDPETWLRDDGLRWRTNDGAFELNLHTAVQTRLTWHDTRGQGENGDNGRDYINFSLPNTRTFLHGHLFDPQFQYRVWLVWSWPGGGFHVLDAHFRWAPDALFNVTVGQMRIPASWEQLVDQERTLIADRSITDEAFNQGWGKGIEISGTAGLYDTADDVALLRWQAGLFNGVPASSDGAQGRGQMLLSGGRSTGIAVTNAGATEHFAGGLRNDDWQLNAENFSQAVDGDLMVAGRLEFHPVGEVNRHMADDVNDEDSAVWRVMVGVAANWMRGHVNGYGTFLGNVFHNVPNVGSIPGPASGRPPVRFEALNVSLDGHFRWLGLSVNWALQWRSVTFDAEGRLNQALDDDDPYLLKHLADRGASVEVSYFVLRDVLNLQVRWAAVDFDEFKSRMIGTGTPVDGDSFGADSQEYGFGVVWTIHGDHLKLSADYRYVTQQLPHGVGKGKAATAGVERVADWRQFQELRLQLQWMF